MIPLLVETTEGLRRQGRDHLACANCSRDGAGANAHVFLERLALSASGAPTLCVLVWQSQDVATLGVQAVFRGPTPDGPCEARTRSDGGDNVINFAVSCGRCQGVSGIRWFLNIRVPVALSAGTRNKAHLFKGGVKFPCCVGESGAKRPRHVRSRWFQPCLFARKHGLQASHGQMMSLSSANALRGNDAECFPSVHHIS